MWCCIQGKNKEARKHIQAGRVTIAGQKETLSQADKKQVQQQHQLGDSSAKLSHALWYKLFAWLQTILLSDTFQLDEHKCVRLLMMAGQQVL